MSCVDKIMSLHPVVADAGCIQRHCWARGADCAAECATLQGLQAQLEWADDATVESRIGWDPHLKCIKGEVTAPASHKSSSTRRGGLQRKDAVNPVESTFPFTNIGGIDDDVLLVRLNRVVTMQKVNDQCGVVKEHEVHESGEMPSAPKTAQEAEVQESGEMPSAPLSSNSACVP